MNDEKAYRLGTCIVIIGEYGRDIFKEYENEISRKIQKKYIINVLTEKENDLIEKNNYQHYIVVGDFKDINTQMIITKLTVNSKSKKIFLIKNMPFMEEKNIGIINTSRKKNVIKSLEALTYLSIKPGIICIDEADIWNLVNNRYFHTKSVKGTMEKVKYAIRESDKINAAEAVLINIVSNNIGLHEINIIAETIQKECKPDSHIVFYYTNAEKMQVGNIEINIIYSLTKSA